MKVKTRGGNYREEVTNVLETFKEKQFLPSAGTIQCALGKASLNLRGLNEVTQHHPVIKQTKHLLLFPRELSNPHTFPEFKFRN